MHLLIPKSKRTQKQNNEQICVKLLGSKLNETSTSAEEVSVVISGAVGVPTSQISEYERGEITNDRGYYFYSQYGLDLADNFLLSMDNEEEN